MKTLFLGSYGYGNLGDELCLIEAMETFPSEENLVVSVSPEWTAACLDRDKRVHVFSEREEIQDHLPIDRVVIGGGALGVLPGLMHLFHWAADARCEVIIHNIGMGELAGQDMGWLEDSTVAGVLRRLTSVTVRDHISAWRWNSLPDSLPRTGEPTYFPETRLASDDTLADVLLAGTGQERLVGISMTNQEALGRAFDRSFVKLALEWESVVRDGRHPVLVPIVSTFHKYSEQENDAVGFDALAERLCLFGREGRGFRMAGTLLKDREWWRKNLTPRGLKGVISRLDCLVTQRKHNMLHAIGLGVKVVGIHPWEDESLPCVFYTMRQYLPAGSRLVAL